MMEEKYPSATKIRNSADQHQGNQCTSIWPIHWRWWWNWGSTTDNADVVKATQFSIGALETVAGSGGNAGNGGVVNLGS